MIHQSLQILESFNFTIDTIKYAEAERNYQLNKTRARQTQTSTNANGTGPVAVTEIPITQKSDNNPKNAKTTVPKLESQSPVVPAPIAIANAATTAPETAPTTTPTTPGTIESSFLSLSEQIAQARFQIQQSLKDFNYTPTKSPLLISHSHCSTCGSSGGYKVDPAEEEAMRVENELLKKKIELLESQVKQLTDRVVKLEIGGTTGSGAGAPAPTSKPSGDAKPKKVEDDDDVDLFGSDEEEDAEAAKIKEARLAEYAAKKSKKPALVAKSNVILDVKPWDDETDMKELEKHVRSIVMDGLLWGSSKLVEIAFGVKKLQISTVIEDDKVSVEELQEKLEAFEDFIQSVDIAAFNKI